MQMHTRDRQHFFEIVEKRINVFGAQMGYLYMFQIKNRNQNKKTNPGQEHNKKAERWTHISESQNFGIWIGQSSLSNVG